MNKQLHGRLIYGFNHEVGQWVADRIDGYSVGENATAIGVLNVEKTDLVAGVTYENWNGVNIEAAIAVDDQTWCNKSVLKGLFGYPFLQLGCEAITISVASSNAASLNIAVKMGFEAEAIIKFAAHDGSSLVVLKMFRDKCRWIRDGKKGRKQSTKGT